MPPIRMDGGISLLLASAQEARGQFGAVAYSGLDEDHLKLFLYRIGSALKLLSDLFVRKSLSNKAHDPVLVIRKFFKARAVHL
jgi:hypothetical protein